ncbi:hypothetical protein DEM34_17825 [Spiribacter halobius]|uniref:SPOR domain-containing protein n=2 Tax=Sediminicurvatus halobius TaxID=2182432 RepID=A0A2U2MWD8_9GAMM|nr:hypothetical protein DEM34_17825 [Spiribacter halobius]
MLLSGPVERTRVDVPLDVPEAPEPIAAPALPEADLLEEPPPGESLADMPRPAPEDAPAVGPATTEGGDSAATAPEADDPAPTDEPSADGDDGAAAEGGFAVQVGGFGSRDNAIRLRDRLREDGFETWVDEAEVDGRTVHRVRVGPVPARDEAEALAQRLAESHELPGLIIAR